MPTAPAPPPEARAAVRSAGLRYVSDDQPGLSRLGSATRLRYRSARGRSVKDAPTLAQIKALAIPLAWRDVWISPHANE